MNGKIFLTLQSESPGGGMVDALVSGASVERRAGSSPVLGTILDGKRLIINRLLFCLYLILVGILLDG